MILLSTLFSVDFDNSVLRIGNQSVNLETVNKVLFKITTIVIIVFLMYLAIKIGNSLIDKFVKNQVESDLRFTMNEKKANTVGEVLKSVLKYTVYFFGITAVLSYLFNGISLTFASIGGVAVGFGAQSLVKDLINGFFILFEDQYAVGDYITVGNLNGIVESIGIRTTILRDFSGDIHLIPNGTISTVTNRSRGNMRIMVDMEIAYEENVDNAIDVINAVCDRFSKDNNDIIDKPQVIGVTSFTQSGITIRVTGSAKPMTQWAIERELRKEIKKELDSQGIEIPYPKTQIIQTVENK
ncbi:mechanosensitive ion channel protein [Clostridium polyendosporum]|uniref:Mechanosensitive ion channel protein n=1 Tax=Clostridium polyendosporum TaxID=69208 RepID=A0A919VGT3_9CLOT|nr:mechanosensitive ion channel family protein [Clostridium polyendosporum]GIM28966.1 mechanosensitive ion channel protein [Clostridium polyendosporum]